jgi:hypothetical protein
MKYLYYLIILFNFSAYSQWQSNLVHYNNQGRLVYTELAGHLRIPDFSWAGYKNSNTAVPDIPVVKTISPISGDNTAKLQAAIDSMAQIPLGANGFRGALLLLPGTYQVNGTVKLNVEGVVLRGSGDGTNPDSSTIIYGKGNSPAQRTILIAGGGSSTSWKDQVSGTKVNITSDSVFIGSREFTVSSASAFSVGDNIIIYHPCTDAWLAAINYGGVHSTDSGAAWAAGTQPIVYNRYITKITGNTITIDAPVFNHLIKSLSQSYIYKYSRNGLKKNIGVENLRIDIETLGGTDENHAWQCLDMYLIEDAWVKNCTFIHFGQSGIRTNTATRITVENCKALDPVALVDGERRYNFQTYTASQQILFKNCHATNGRHHYVSNGTSWTSGVVFTNCTSSGAYTSSEGHRRWSQGFLYDQHTELDGPRAGLNPRLLGLYNRGNMGTSHGWAIANSVAWNCDLAAGDLIVQQPPTAQNYAIGCKGAHITGTYPPAPFDEPGGYIEGSNLPGLQPASLFEAQLNDRLSTTSVKDHGEIINDYKLYPAYPNPFNPGTKFSFLLKKRSFITLKIFDLLGKEISTIVNSSMEEGFHEIEFKAENLTSGVYVYLFKANNQISTGKLVLLK